jgi:hypothetical protein
MMADYPYFTSVESHCLLLFVEWFNEQYGARLVPPATEAGPPDFAPPVFVCTDSNDGKRLAVFVRALYDEGEPWQSYRRQLEEQFGAGLPGGYILWVPPGADLPADAPAREAFLNRVRQAAASLDPGERADVVFPVSLRLTKLREEGAYISVEGGLSHLWARMSEGASGSYFLDARTVHRIPATEEYERELMQAIAAAARDLAAGQSTAVAAIDAWALQRLHGGSGLAIAGAPQRTAEEAGTMVRRLLRRTMAEASARFAPSMDRLPADPSAGSGQAPSVTLRADLHALLVIGNYTHMEQEGVSTAFRGFDPAIYANLEMMALAADAQIRVVIPPRLMPWGGSR